MTDVGSSFVASVVGSGIVAVIAKFAIDKWLHNIERDSETLRDMEKEMAVMSHRVEKMEKDLNGIGVSIRKMAGSTK